MCIMYCTSSFALFPLVLRLTATSGFACELNQRQFVFVNVKFLFWLNLRRSRGSWRRMGSPSYQQGNKNYFCMQNISDIYFVGGFGTVVWLDVNEYKKAKPDVIVVKGADNILKVLDSSFFLILVPQTFAYLFPKLWICLMLLFSSRHSRYNFCIFDLC